jgi:hypothetical protein
MARNVTPRRGARVAKEGFARMDKNELDALEKRARSDGMLFVSACLGKARARMAHGTVNLVVPDILLCALPEINVPLSEIMSNITELYEEETDTLRDQLAAAIRQRDTLKEAVIRLKRAWTNDMRQQGFDDEDFLCWPSIKFANEALASLDQEPQQ